MTESGTRGLSRRTMAEALSADVRDSNSKARRRTMWGSRGGMLGVVKPREISG